MRFETTPDKCLHPQSRIRVERVVMPEAVYRTPHCMKCGFEFPEQRYEKRGRP